MFHKETVWRFAVYKLNWAFPSNNFLSLHFKNYLKLLLWVTYFYSFLDCKKKQAKNTKLTFWHLYYTNKKKDIFVEFIEHQVIF